MERLTNHFNHCDFIGCGWLEENVCRVFGTDTEKCHRKSVYEKLREYEDLEEQGLLLRLPVPIGTKIYSVMICQPSSCGVCKTFNWNDGCYPECHGQIVEREMLYVDIPKFGKKVFLTKEEAEQALARMEKEND